MASTYAPITAKTRKALRAHYLERNERVRITKNGEVHALGTIPHTNQRGWYLVGFDTNLIETLRWEGEIEA